VIIALVLGRRGADVVPNIGSLAPQQN